MPTKKKAPAKGKARLRTTVQRAATRQSSAQQLAANTLNIKLLTVSFTLLCIVFAVEAFWQYCR